MMIYWPDNPLINLLFLIVGIIFLYKSADILIEGTSKTAAKIGISSLERIPIVLPMVCPIT